MSDKNITFGFSLFYLRPLVQNPSSGVKQGVVVLRLYIVDVRCVEYECAALVDSRNYKYQNVKSVPVPLYPQYIPQGLVWVRTRPSVITELQIMDI